MTRPGDFRAAVRQGRRVNAPTIALHVRATNGDPTRFGFIVTKAVGKAVTRNLVRRRLREICRELLASMPVGRDIVIRALPGSDSLDWVSLHSQVVDGVGRAVNRS